MGSLRRRKVTFVLHEPMASHMAPWIIFLARHLYSSVSPRPHGTPRSWPSHNVSTEPSDTRWLTT